MITRVLNFLDRFHWIWLAIATPFLLFPTTRRSVVMLVIPALFMVRWLALKKERKTASFEAQKPSPKGYSIIQNTPLNGVLLLLMLMVIISLWATFDINYSLPRICGMILGLGIFFAYTREGQAPRGWWLGLLLFMGIGFGVVLLGLLGTNWVSKFSILTPIISRLGPRITGLPGAEEGFNQNGVAGMLMWVIPSFCAFSAYLLRKAKDLRAQYGYGRTTLIIVLMVCATLAMIIILVLTQSRESYIDLSLTLLVMTLIGLPPRWRRYGFRSLVLLIIIFGVLLAYHSADVGIGNRNGFISGDSALSPSTFNVRLEIWSRAIYGIQDFPFTGMGMSGFRKVMPVLYSMGRNGPNNEIPHAHNEFLQAALDLGIPGLIAFIGLYIVAFWMLIRTWKSIYIDQKFETKTQATSNRLAKLSDRLMILDASPLAEKNIAQILIIGLGGGLLAHMLWGLTDALGLGSRPAFPFWIILGLICGLHQQAMKH
jgi:putative inorganic carbon (hco3(-)) transporter